MSDYTIGTGSVTMLRAPEFSDWQVTVSGVTYRPLKGQEPNRFHRWMQGLCFGFVWRRRD